MKLKIAILTCIISLAIDAIAAPPNEIGKTIFSTQCASCHNINKIIVGPALAGVDQRHSIDWIIKFVQSSQALIKSGDKDAIALFDKFNHIPMPDHPDLKADDIKSIVDYIKSQTNAGVNPDKAPFAKPSQLHPAFVPLSISDYWFFAAVFGLVALLVFLLLFYVRVKEYERNKQYEKPA